MNRTARMLARIGLPAIGAAAFFVSAPTPLRAAPESPPAAQPADLTAAVGALRAISTLRADFIQTNRNGQRIAGVLTMKRPGRIRFQYEKGVPLLIVGDGKALTFVDSSIRPPQIQRWPISNSPLGALLDPNRDVFRYGHLQPVFDRNIVSVEVRDPKHPEYGVITLVFARKPGAPGGMELSAWVALDSQNQRTTVRLTGQQYGMDLPDSQFRVLDTSIRPHK
ncbi:MAG: outer membrane lipoprotein carrier protein LolA [Sphingomonadales bacterium]|nr:outer membrane lipoprotein carrier protein LolA [Sphingomonadales bacterium]